MKRHHLLTAALTLLLTVPLVGLPVRAADEAIDYDAINKIKTQGLVVANSKVMEVSSWLTDVHGPRLSGSPGIQKAGEWAVAQMKAWGLENVRLEPWPADASGNNNGFPRGWTNDKFYLAATTPQAFPIPGTPSAWTPGTNGLVSGEVVMVSETTEEDLKTKYAGKLKGKWVITNPAPDVQAYWNAPAERLSREELARSRPHLVDGPERRVDAVVLAAPVRERRSTAMRSSRLKASSERSQRRRAATASTRSAAARVRRIRRRCSRP
jgi:hypothetical protein